MCLLHSDKFELLCTRCQASEQRKLASYASPEWNQLSNTLSPCPLEWLTRAEGPAQCHMDWLVDLYTFAHTYDIHNLKIDTLQALEIVLQVGEELPNYKILNKAFSVNRYPGSLLSKYLKDLYDINWSPAIATNLTAAKNESLHSEVVDILVRNLMEDLETSQLERENLSQQTQRDKQLTKELAEARKALAEANARVAKQEPTQRVKEDQAQLVNGEKAELEKENVFNRSQKRARNDDGEMVPKDKATGIDGAGLDASEVSRQSLKRPRCPLRPKTNPLY